MFVTSHLWYAGISPLTHLFECRPFAYATDSRLEHGFWQRLSRCLVDRNTGVSKTGFLFVGGGWDVFLIQLLYREIPGSPCFHHFYMLNYVNSLWMKLNTSFFFESMGLKTSSKRNRAPCFMKWWGCRPPGVCIHNLKRYLKNGPSFEPLVAPGCFWKKLIFKCGQVLLQRIDTKWPCDP